MTHTTAYRCIQSPRFFLNQKNIQAAAKALKKLLKKEKKKAAAEAAASAESAAPIGRPRTRSMDLAEATSGRPRTRSMDAAEGTAAAVASPSKAEKKKKKKRKAEDTEESSPKKSKTAAAADVAANGITPVAVAAAAPLTAAEFGATHKIAVKSDDASFEVPVPMASFESTPFGGPIRGALKAAGYPAPTPTQAQ